MSPRYATPFRRRAIAVACALFAGALVLASSMFSARRSRAEVSAPPAAAPAHASASAVAPLTVAPPAPPARLEGATIEDELGRPIEVYPPLEPTSRAPLVVMLHATCMQPRPVCDLLGRAGRDGSFLVCPAGNDTCYGEPDWHGSPEVKSAFLDRDLTAVESRYGAAIDRVAGDVLIGWSRGAFAARDILYARVAAGAPRRFHAVLLIAAAVSPDPVRFKAAGVRRVVFSAGDQDGSRPVMKRAAAVLSAAGIESRYVSLGAIGHWLPSDLEARLRDEIVWARGGGDGS